MPSFVISYDLRNKRDYEKLYEAIKSYGTWSHILESCWAVVTTKSATEIRKHLVQFIDKDDGIFISRSAGEAAWRNVSCTNDWLKEHI